MKKKMSNRDKTFWAVVIPVVVLFFAFNATAITRLNTFTSTVPAIAYLKVNR